MATYVYETIDPSKPVRRFEVQQSMNDSALSHDPMTGDPVRRVITGGFGVMTRASSSASASGGDCGAGMCGLPDCAPQPSGHSCGIGCGCA